MNRLLSAFLVLTLTLLGFTRTAEAAKCRMAILVDHSGSMQTLRTDGVLDPQGKVPTRCEAAGLVVGQLLQAFTQGNSYDISKTNDSGVIVSSTDKYDTTCPNPSDRTVSIRVFKSKVTPGPNSSIVSTFDQVTQTPVTPSIDGFIPVEDAYAAWFASPYWDKNAHAPAACDVNDFTPLADGMCTMAKDFGPGKALGNLNQAFTLTDGGENSSYLTGCRIGSDSDAPGLPGAGGWGDRVTSEYLTRGLEGHGFLFTEGAQNMIAKSAALSVASSLEPMQLLRPKGFGTLAATATTPSSDQAFFQDLANKTGGTLAVVPDSQPIAATSNTTSTTDTDGDGVPDFRDFCPFGMCVDSDGDQIPNSMDACIFTEFEDGKGPFAADGCADFDADGIHDGVDQCPTKLEDWYPPQPNDGCPRIVAAAPAASGLMLGLLGFGMLGLGIMKARRSRRLVAES